MKNPLHFFTELFKRPTYEIIWVVYMMGINMAAIFFWDEPLAKTIIIVFLLSSMLMMGLYSKFGFTKILGLGHILWVPLAVLILAYLPAISGVYYLYLVTLLITISVSLVIDFYDVWSYLRDGS